MKKNTPVVFKDKNSNYVSSVRFIQAETDGAWIVSSKPDMELSECSTFSKSEWELQLVRDISDEQQFRIGDLVSVADSFNVRAGTVYAYNEDTLVFISIVSGAYNTVQLSKVIVKQLIKE